MPMATDSYMKAHRGLTPGFGSYRSEPDLEFTVPLHMQSPRKPRTFTSFKFKRKVDAPLTREEVVDVANKMVTALKAEQTALAKVRKKYNIALGLPAKRARRFLDAERYAIQARNARANIAAEIALIQNLTRI